MSELAELVEGRKEAESSGDSKAVLEERVLAGQGDVPSAGQGALPRCHPAHEGTLLQHTAVTPAAPRGRICAGDPCPRGRL